MGSITFELETSSGTYNTFQVEHYESSYYVPKPGKTLSLDVACGSSNVRDNLIDLIGASGQAAYGTDIRGTGWYVDRIRPDSPLASVATVVTTNNLPELDGVFGVCVGGEDSTTIPGSKRPLRIELAVIANPANTGATSLSDFQNNYEVSVP